MLFPIVLIAAHILPLGALLYFLTRVSLQLPDDLRSFDVIGSMVAGLVLIAVMLALPHWGFGR
jgi:hypothetical protein